MSPSSRRKFLSPRLLPLYVLAAATVAWAAPTAGSLAMGGGLVACGMGLRVWGAGHLVKTDCLTVTGPYAHLRHPLYAGTLLVAGGFAVMAAGAVAAVAVAVLLPFFFGYYLPYKERIESARLERRYGAAYTSYRAAVRPLLPSLVAWQPPEARAEAESRQDAVAWDARRFGENSEAGTVFAVAVALALFALRAAVPW